MMGKITCAVKIRNERCTIPILHMIILFGTKRLQFITRWQFCPFRQMMLPMHFSDMQIIGIPYPLIVFSIILHLHGRIFILFVFTFGRISIVHTPFITLSIGVGIEKVSFPHILPGISPAITKIKIFQMMIYIFRNRFYTLTSQEMTVIIASRNFHDIMSRKVCSHSKS